MAKYERVLTNVQEVYMKLPMLNYSNEIILSETVPQNSIKAIMGKFNKNNRIVLEMTKVGNKTMLIKKGEMKFNTYLV
jgi:hypothetical protein